MLDTVKDVNKRESLVFKCVFSTERGDSGAGRQNYLKRRCRKYAAIILVESALYAMDKQAE